MISVMIRNHLGGLPLNIILRLRFHPVILAILSVCAVLLALLPLYRLTMDAIPRYDDYSYGIRFWQDLRYGFGLRAMWDAGFHTALDCHYSWQGTYSSIFMMALMPGAMGFEYYFLGPVLLITSMTFCTFFMVWTLTKYFLKADLADRILLSSVITLALVELIHTAQQGFYWYNSGVHYTFMHSMFFLLVSVCVALSFSGTRIRSVLLCLAGMILSFICAGANFVTCLQGLLFLISAAVYTFFKNRKHSLWFVPVLLIYTIGFFTNVTAPGNANRQAWYTGDPAPMAIFHSYTEAFRQLPRFTGLYMLIFALLAFPVILRMVQKTTFSFRFPGLFLFLTFSFYATGFTSSFYSMGTHGLARTWIAIKMTCQILFFANEIYWTGYWIRLMERKPIASRRFSPLSDHYVLYYLVVLLLFLGAFRITQDKIGSVSSWGAYYYVHSGEANNFHNEFLNRVAIIQSCPDPVVAVPSYKYLPWFLINQDISVDSNEEENRIMAKYFGKEILYRLPD